MDIIDKNTKVARRVKLSPEKQALINQRLQTKITMSDAVSAIPSLAATTAPLSFVQESVWLQHQLEPEGITYNLPAAIRLQGSVNVAILESSINAIIQRHAILRTKFVLVDHQPTQIIEPKLVLKLPFIDLTALDEDKKSTRIQQLIDEEAQFHFDLGIAPLLRITLVAVNTTELIILFTTHHIISDGWSRLVFMRELLHFYEATLNNKQPSLPDLPIQYADFANWQREQLKTGALAKQLNYWQQQLQEAPVILELPTDNTRPNIRTFNGKRQLFEVNASTTSAIKYLSQQKNTTLFMTLLAAFQVLLYRYTGQEDFLIGSPITNRQRTELENLIGFFANTLVLRARLSGEMRFTDLLLQVKQTALSAYANQDVPFEKLVELVQKERSSSYSPLFQVMFAAQNSSIEEIQLPSLSLSLMTEDSDAAKFDLSLTIGEYQQKLQAKLEYNCDLFEEVTINRLINHFQNLLLQIVSDPEQTIGQLSFLTPAEVRQLLDFGLPHQKIEAYTELCIHELFLQQVEKTPHAEALSCEGETLTYAQLNAEANQVAQHLRSMGVGPEVIVGLCVERSLHMIIGLLGILKAGGAYLPLDPHYPAQRLNYIIEDAALEFLLTEENLVIHLNNKSLKRIDIAACLATPETFFIDDFVKSTTQNLAYAIYTSGSTGKPKGVLVEHRNVISFMQAIDQALGTTPGVWLAQTSISFDISVLELLWTLTRGFKVVIAKQSLIPAPSKFSHQDKAIAFSLFYFSSSSEVSADSYRLLLDGARFADKHGFAAIWTPERHFANFGGLYPNPAITSAAIATVTERISIRAGSCVLPLHNPVQIAEDWAMVDNISQGRVAVSFASGWQPNDFVLAPLNYAERNKIMFEGIEKVQALWRGDSVNCVNGLGQDIDVRILPRPIQPELPMWLTASGNPETFRQAGAAGLNLLTHLLGQSKEELAEKIAIYRKAWRDHGHKPGEGQVTLMLHSFIAESEEVVLAHVKNPLKKYLRDSIALLKPFADAMGQDIQQASEEDMEVILEHAFTRYYQTSGLFGTVDSCQLLIDELKGIGVNEIACLIDFGIDTNTVLESFTYLDELHKAVQPNKNPTSHSIESVSELIQKHQVSHFQCTASLAGFLVNDKARAEVLKNLQYFLVGGESLPLSLAQALCKYNQTKILNMYGPTEATVWSTLYKITAGLRRVCIGQPLANTKIAIVDKHNFPVPIGIIGEILIAGEGVVRGYLNRPELTAERFIILNNQRFYTTGDRGRYLADGNIEHLGRMDMQIKIRGFRVELGEIEKVISEYPDIQEVIVVLTVDKTASPQLVACCVWKQHVAENPKGLREHVQLQLPDYMMPAFFLTMAALPLTPNGKIDRKALENLELQDNIKQVYVAPNTALETQIAKLWETTMNRSSIGIHDNFFELGGHSLLAAELANKIQQATSKRLSLTNFFEYPTIAQLALFLQGSADESIANTTLPVVLEDKAMRYQPFPLTDVQQAYLIGRSGAFELGNISTHGYVELDLTDCDPQKLVVAWNQLILRHDMLRMIIVENSLQQILEKTPYYEIAIEDLSHFSTEKMQDFLLATRNAMSHQVLPAGTWPLFDLRISKMPEGRHRLHISLDTLIADGFSSDILFKEFFILYAGLDQKLPELKLSFRDYVNAELQIKKTELYRRSREYWLNRISTLALAPKLPLAKDPSQITHPTFIRRSKTLDKQQWQNLKKKAQKTGITPSVLLLTAYAEILGQWSKDSDFCLNLTLFHRLPLHEDVNHIIGDFTSLTVLEINQKPGETFVARSQAIQKQLWRDLEHKYFSGVEVLREVARHYKSQRIAAAPVVFTSTLDTQDKEATPANQNVQELGEEVFVITQTPQVWLDHQVVEREGKLQLTWDAVEELFPESMLDDMFATYSQLLEHLAEDLHVWELPYLPLLPAYQIHQRAKINHTKSPESSQLLHHLFVEQAQLRAKNYAVITPELKITYEALNRMAIALSHQLRQLHCQPNDLIAVVMEKGWEQVVAVMGILMAGSAYLPIDASLPKERVMHLLETGAVKIAITQVSSQNAFTWPAGINTISLDLDWLNVPHFEPLASIQTIDDLAYVLFTSGSTGTPKGVMIDHRGAMNTILDINQRFSITDKDAVLALSSLSFDLSVYDIFGLLAAGGTLVFPEPALLKDPAHWLKLIEDNGITIWNTVPMFLQMLVDHLEHQVSHPVKTLRLALISGDWIPINLPDRCKQAMKALQVISLGGATEASIWSIIYPIERVLSHWKTIPYGKPMLNQAMHVLKPDLTPCPTWLSGDIYISGIGLAKGYWKDNQKTQASFIINQHTGERLYKTGDLGRYLPDGNIEFLGREDYQVKIQGYRVELGEIEAALLQHEAIEQAVVLATAMDNIHTKRLVAYVVSSPQKSTIAEKAFTLSQPGIRKFHEENTSITLPDLDKLRPLTCNHFSQKKASKNLNGCIALQDFGAFLHVLRSIKSEEMLLPKYHYPSAGSLYPVQAYLMIKDQSIEDIAPGMYYYHPGDHRLIWMNPYPETLTTEAHFSLFLIADINAMKPVYDELTHQFCALEAGYISQLLTASSAFNNNIVLESVPQESSHIKQYLDLEDHYYFLQAFSGYAASVDTQPHDGGMLITRTYLARQSFQQFNQANISLEKWQALLGCIQNSALENIKIYAHIKPNILETMEEGGVYHVEYTSGQLTRCENADVIQENMHTFNNQPLFQSASFSLFFLVDASKVVEDSHLIAIGALGQVLMDVAADNLMGICPIGTMNWKNMEDTLALNNKQVLLHSFVGGSIDSAQLLQLKPRETGIKTVDPTTILQAFLQNKIPHYMIPSIFIPLEALPQSANGKVDRKALPVATITMAKKNQPSLPETALEEQ